jgi:hypothetical protein
MTEPEAALLEVAVFLERSGLRYMLIGGMAVAVWGVPRPVLDVDLWVRVDSAALDDVIRAIATRFRAAPHRLARALVSHILYVTAANGVQAQLMFTTGLDDGVFMARARTKCVAGFDIPVQCVEDVIYGKIEPARPQDLADIRGLLKRFGGSLDLRQLRNRCLQSIIDPQTRCTIDQIFQEEIKVHSQLVNLCPLLERLSVIATWKTEPSGASWEGRAASARTEEISGSPEPTSWDHLGTMPVPYVPTPPEVVETMLKVGEVKEGDILYDLGCGDGRIVIMAAQKFGATGIGLDIDPERIKEAEDNARQAGVSDRVRFLQKNFFDADFHDATVVTLYLLPHVNMLLRPKLLKELKVGTRIVSWDAIGDWKPDKKVGVYLWTVTERAKAEWKSTGGGTHIGASRDTTERSQGGLVNSEGLGKERAS